MNLKFLLPVLFSALIFCDERENPTSPEVEPDNIKVVIQTPIGTQSYKIDLNFTVVDRSDNSNTFRIVYQSSPHEIAGASLVSTTSGTITKDETGKPSIIKYTLPGNHKIVWNSSADFPNKSTSTMKIRIYYIDQKNDQKLVAETQSFKVDNSILTNYPPTASFRVNPKFGTTETAFNLDAIDCFDSEEPSSSLQVRWDWENDGIWDTNYSFEKTTIKRFETEGIKSIVLEVIDSDGRTDTETRQVTVNNGIQETGTVIDFDGNVYMTVKLGSQYWIAENLRVTHYRNGDSIPNVTGNDEWVSLSTGAYCSYNNNEEHVAAYGRLYNWFACIDQRQIAPIGWHVPTDKEWQELELFLGMSWSEVDYYGPRGNRGGALKEAGTFHWNSPNTGATNESGFTALPAGFHFSGANFRGLGDGAYFWSVTEHDDNSAWYRELEHDHSAIVREIYYSKRSGFSIRCVKD